MNDLLQHYFRTFGKIQLLIGNMNVIFQEIMFSFLHRWHRYQSLVMTCMIPQIIQFGNNKLIFALNPNANFASNLNGFAIKTQDKFCIWQFYCQCILETPFQLMCVFFHFKSLNVLFYHNKVQDYLIKLHIKRNIHGNYIHQKNQQQKQHSS